MVQPLYDSGNDVRSTQTNNSVFCRMDEYPDGNYSYPEHWHEYLEIIYSLEGSYRITINGVAYELSTGDLVFINSRRVHGVNATGDGVHRFIVIQFEPQIFNSSQRAEYLAAMPFIFTRRAHRFLFTAQELAQSPIPATVEDIYQEEMEQKAGREIAMHMYLLQIFIWMLRRWHTEDLSRDEQASMRHLHCIIPAFDYIANHFADRILATDLSKLCNLSYTHFCRQFRDITGQTFTTYINQVRIVEAQKLLFNSTRTITEIAELVGFSDVNYFIRKFKAATGVSPYRFKKISCHQYGSEEHSLGSGNG